MHGSLRVRLSVLMFLQYGALGLWCVTLATFLKASPEEGGLNFTGQQVAWLYSTFAIAAAVSPLLAGLLADRYFPSQKVLAVLHLIGGVLLALTYASCVSTAPTEEKFTPLFWLLLAYNLCYLPSTTLASALCFRNLPEPGRQFGQARVFGTIGWIAAGLFVGYALPAVSAVPLLLAAIVSAVLSVFCLALPHTPPLAQSKHFVDMLGLPALRMFGNRAFFVFAVCSLSCSVLVAFHNVFTNPFLVDLPVLHSAAVQTIGQTTEIVGILLIPYLRGRFGFRWLLTMGLVASAIRFFGYASGSIPIVLAVGLPMHGLGFSLFYITAAIYVDMQSPADLRASAQGLITQLTSGVGALVGIGISGFAVDALTVDGAVAWPTVWLIPAIGTVGIALVFAIFFREPQRQVRPLDEAERVPAPRIGETELD